MAHNTDSLEGTKSCREHRNFLFNFQVQWEKSFGLYKIRQILISQQTFVQVVKQEAQESKFPLKTSFFNMNLLKCHVIRHVSTKVMFHSLMINPKSDILRHCIANISLPLLWHKLWRTYFRETNCVSIFRGVILGVIRVKISVSRKRYSHWERHLIKSIVLFSTKMHVQSLRVK